MTGNKTEKMLEMPCKGCDTGKFTGGIFMKPYPTADYELQVFKDKDFQDDTFKVLRDQAAEFWHDRCEAYVKEHGDQGTSVLGARLEVAYLGPRKRKIARKRFLKVPASATQGASTWEESVRDVLEFLRIHGIEATYNPGFMD